MTSYIEESKGSQDRKQKSKSKSGEIKNSILLILAFATAFFPRFFSYFGAPSLINFAHFATIPGAALVTIVTSKNRDRRAVSITSEILIGLAIFLACMIFSGLVNGAGIVNIILQFMFQSEPFLLLAGIMIVPMAVEKLKRFEYWLLSFALINWFLAFLQTFLIPIGIYPKRGGTDQDAITGVFGGGGGSAANYVSCTVSFYIALYFWTRFKSLPIWIRALPLLGALFQTQVSDSKQCFLAFVVGWGLLALTKVEKPIKIFSYLSLGLIGVLCFSWALANVKSEFLSPYQNWTNRPIWGWDGLAAQTKFAVLRIVPSYFESPLNWLVGLGPGHTGSRLGGWVLRDYASLLMPLGATLHPATLDFWKVINTTYLPQESTIFFPMFTWAGIWGDGGILGLGAYLYLCSIAWRRICVDDFGKFLMLSTFSFGWILTQMEEPGHMLTVACLLALRWKETRITRG